MEITEILNKETQGFETFIEQSNIVIKTEHDREKATEIIVLLKKKYDVLEETRTSFVKPLNDQVKFINSNFKKYTEKLDLGITKLKRGISNYLLEQERIAREKEEKEFAKLEAKNAKREADGKAPILKTIESEERPSSMSKVDGGKTGSRKVWKFEIINPSIVPNEMKSPDLEKIKLAVSSGARQIDGVRIYEDIIISASAY